MIKVGVVGVGNIGSIHTKVYHENPKSELVAVCDIIPEKADKAAEMTGAKAFYSVQEMLDSGIELDACSVCTKGEENGGDHFTPTMELLNAGIPVLGEKPISNNIEEGIKMVALAKEKKLPYGVNLNHRFTPAAWKAKEWMNEGRLGDINMINMKMWINNPVETSEWFHLRALHPHSFDVMRFFMGDIKRIGCFVKKGEGRITYSNAQILIEFESGAIGHLVGSYDAGGSYGLENCEVTGSKGRFVIEEACQVLKFGTRDSAETEQYDFLGGMLHFNETFKSRIGYWIDQMDAKTPYDEIEASGEMALKAQTYIEAAIESAKTGQIVTIKK